MSIYDGWGWRGWWHVEVSECDINITHSQNVADTCNKLNLNVKCSLAKTPPHQNLIIEKLMEKFSTTNFLTALSLFLCHNLLGMMITPSNCPIWHLQTNQNLFTNQQISGWGCCCGRVKTAPSINASGWVLSKTSHFDTVHCWRFSVIWFGRRNFRYSFSFLQ